MQSITEELIQEIKERIVSAVHPEKIILLGRMPMEFRQRIAIWIYW